MTHTTKQPGIVLDLEDNEAVELLARMLAADKEVERCEYSLELANDAHKEARDALAAAVKERSKLSQEIRDPDFDLANLGGGTRDD